MFYFNILREIGDFVPDFRESAHKGGAKQREHDHGKRIHVCIGGDAVVVEGNRQTTHGTKAYAYGAEHQLAMTGTVGGGFYQHAEAEVIALVAAALLRQPVGG